MITFNLDGEIFRASSWDDIIARPMYCSEIDPAAAEVDRVLAIYQLDPPVRCGLASCHTLHNKGFIVQTKDGRETNIGHVCGKKYFADFESARRTFERGLQRKTRKETIQTFQSMIPIHEERLEALHDGPNGAAVIRQAAESLRSTLPDSIRDLLNALVRAGDGRLTIERQATSEEHELMEAQQRRGLERPLVIQEAVGNIAGISFFDPANDLRELLVVDLEQGLKRLRDLDADHSTDATLASECRWLGEFDQKVERVETIMRAGRAFLTKKNLKQFERAEISSKDVAALRRAANDLPRWE